jgi:hypothetical protein
MEIEMVIRVSGSPQIPLELWQHALLFLDAGSLLRARRCDSKLLRFIDNSVIPERARDVGTGRYRYCVHLSNGSRGKLMYASAYSAECLLLSQQLRLRRGAFSDPTSPMLALLRRLGCFVPAQ